jgi:hypothetical protein
MQRVSCNRMSRSQVAISKCQASSTQKTSTALPVKAHSSLIRLPWQIKSGIIGAGGSLTSVVPAWAEDAFTSAVLASTDVAGPAADDPVITVMFTLAILALSVVTLGVRFHIDLLAFSVTASFSLQFCRCVVFFAVLYIFTN